MIFFALQHVNGAVLNVNTSEEDTDSVDALIADAMNDAHSNESNSALGTHFGTSRSVRALVLRLWSKSSFQIFAHNTYALACHFSPDSTMIATTSADHTAKLWRTVDYCKEKRRETFRNEVLLVFS